MHKPYPVPYPVHHQKHIIQRPVSVSNGWGALGGLGNLGGWGGLGGSLGGGHGHSGQSRVIHVSLGHQSGHSHSLGPWNNGPIHHSHDLPWGGSAW